MTVGLSTTNTVNAWLNVLSGTTFNGAAGSYAELHTADPGANGTTAVSVGSTTRQSLSWSAASAGSKSLASAPSAWTNGGTSETLTHIAVFSASSAGTFYFSVALTTPQAWASDNTFTLTSLSISIAPLAA